MTTFRDLTPEELKYADRDLLAGRLAAIQQERAKLVAQLAEANTVVVGGNAIRAVESAAEECDLFPTRTEAETIARAVFKAAGFLVVTR